MFSKKKVNGSPKPQSSSFKPVSKPKNLIKTHSRLLSLQSGLMDTSRLILRNFQQSSRQMNERQLRYNIDSLICSHSSTFAVATKQVILSHCQLETLKTYYIFSKHQQSCKNRPTIEIQLVALIRNDFIRHANRPFPHFQNHIYPIMKKHLLKTKRFRKKNAELYGNQPLQQPKTVPKELPTANSEEFDARAYDLPIQHKNGRSESFQLRALTECIKQMFTKQSQKNQLGISVNHDQSWLGPNHNQSKKQFIDCDFSSIEAHSKFDLMIESKEKFKEPEGYQSNYGLQELKRKHEDIRISQICENQPQSRPFGHRRNPTDVLPEKKSDFYGNPMTPKEQAARSEFGSSDNIPFEKMVSAKKKSQKPKQKQVYEPYMLKFDRKKVEKKETVLRGPFKQNLKTQRKRSKQQLIRSKSRSSKKSGLQPRKKRIQAQF